MRQRFEQKGRYVDTSRYGRDEGGEWSGEDRFVTWGEAVELGGWLW